MAELVIYFFPVFSATLEKAREVALSSGLEYVYIGNVPGHEGENTSITRRRVENYIRTRSVPEVDPTTLNDALKIPCGDFVTLIKRGTLRGCIGRFDASEPLYKVVLETAVASTTQDYRLSFLLLFFLTPAKFSMGYTPFSLSGVSPISPFFFSLRSGS